MTTSLRDNEITERLRLWMDENYGSRGRFTLLQEASGIPSQRWKNLFYRRQFATDEMLEFVHKISTNDHLWITSGIRQPLDEEYPFLARPPTKEARSTLAGRLIWTIKEWASPRGAALFEYLEEKSKGRIKADAWAAMFLENAEPTADMIEVVCAAGRPYFAAWIVTGFGPDQVDPTDEASIEQWKAHKNSMFDALAASLDKNSKK